MNAAVSPLPSPGAATRLGPMDVFVKGKVDAVRRHGQVTYTRVVTPAPDPYSRPQLLEVRSKARFGQAGEEVQVVCKLGGFSRKPFKSTDADGVITMVTPIDHTLDLVE